VNSVLDFGAIVPGSISRLGETLSFTTTLSVSAHDVIQRRPGPVIE